MEQFQTGTVVTRNQNVSFHVQIYATSNVMNLNTNQQVWMFYHEWKSM